MLRPIACNCNRNSVPSKHNSLRHCLSKMTKVGLYDNTQILFADVPTPILIVPKGAEPEAVAERLAAIQNFWGRTLDRPSLKVETCEVAPSRCPDMPSIESIDHAFSWYSHFDVDVSEAVEDIRNVLLSGTCQTCGACAQLRTAVDECISRYLR